MVEVSNAIGYELSDLESYGGNPLVIATQGEINRVASEINIAAQFLKADAGFSSWIKNPLELIRYHFASSGILEKLDSLYVKCIFAAESYFTTEAQISRRFEIKVIPQLAEITLSFAGFMGWSFEPNLSVHLANREEIPNAPDSVSSMIERLGSLSKLDKPTIGIDEYLVAGQSSRVFVVTIPGTQEFSLGSSSNPLDMSSNIQAMSGSGVAHSEQAVLKAIAAEGISKDDQVIFVGHSQGAMLAANIASQSNGFLVAGIVAFGGPLAQVALRKNIPVLAIEHKNDPVPNLSGKANPMKPNWVTVQRKANPEEAGGLFYAHDLEGYKNTSQLVDKSKDVGITRVKNQIFSLLEKTEFGTRSDYQIRRDGKF